MANAEGYRQLGNTSVYVNKDCMATVQPMADAKARIPITELSCEGSCEIAGRKALFGTPLNAPEGGVPDTFIRSKLEFSCPLPLEPLTAPQTEAKPTDTAPTMTTETNPSPVVSAPLIPSQAAAL